MSDHGSFRAFLYFIKERWRKVINNPTVIVILVMFSAGVVGIFVADGIAKIASAAGTAALFIGALVYSAYELWRDEHMRADELEARLADKANRKKICEGLAILMMQGRDLMSRCNKLPVKGVPATLPTEAEIDVWDQKTQDYIRKHLGAVYFAQYLRPTGTPAKGVAANAQLDEWWSGIRYRVEHLNDFIEEFK